MGSRPVTASPFPAIALAAVTAYSVSVFIHISTALIGFGATFAEALTFPVAMKLDKRHLPYVQRLGMAIKVFLMVTKPGA